MKYSRDLGSPLAPTFGMAKKAVKAVKAGAAKGAAKAAAKAAAKKTVKEGAKSAVPKYKENTQIKVKKRPLQ